jgi:transglycosylase-like protein with SLT domain
MKIHRALILLLITTSCLVANAGWSGAAIQSKTYQQMTLAERGAFVSEQARRLARQMSGRDYQFTPSFEAEIQKSVDFYARRIGSAGDPPAKGDYRLVFERGQTLAPTLSGIFKAQNVSPLIGLYLPLIESAYVNIPSSNSAGAIGMFQFLPKTGAHFGLSEADLLDVPKSADAAARYIAAGLETFKDDPMKEALALLAYNRGGDNVDKDLATLVNAQNRGCSICVLTEQRDKLDANFQKESVYYVPRFFAAAIVGENPQAFGLKTAPLSSL